MYVHGLCAQLFICLWALLAGSVACFASLSLRCVQDVANVSSFREELLSRDFECSLPSGKHPVIFIFENIFDV